VRTRTALHAGVGLAQVELGAGQARNEKFFVQVTECWAKAHKRISSKIAIHANVLKLFASIALEIVSLQQLFHYDVTTHCCKTLAQTLAML